MTALAAGQLNRRVSFQSKTRHRDDFGAERPDYAELFDRWAEVTPLSSSERVVGSGVKGFVSHRIRIRYDPTWATVSAVPTDIRIRWGNRIFEIEGGFRVDEANETVEFLCSETQEHGDNFGKSVGVGLPPNFGGESIDPPPPIGDTSAGQ